MLWDDFSQADTTTIRRFGGTGLGLSISKRLTKAMGGEIGMQSTLGAGSTFWFTVALGDDPTVQRDVHSSLEVEQAAPPAGSGAKLLLAEDDKVNQAVAVAMLEKCGYRVEIAENGLQALEMLESESYEAVLMDCQMPELDGYQATHEIRRGESAGERIPIIAITAHSMTSDRDKCIAAGMDDYISKPVRIEQLAAVLERWVPEAVEPAVR